MLFFLQVDIHRGVLFRNNTAGRASGGPAATPAPATDPDENQGTWGGGAIFASAAANLTISDDVTFLDNNSPAGDGGAIFASGNSSVTMSNGVMFRGNTAGNENSTMNGGGMGLKDDATVYMLGGVRFVENIGMSSGGGLAMLGKPKGTLIDVSFERNHAETGGGGVYADFDASVIISGCVFDSNTAGSGAAISGLADAVVTVNNGTQFLNNSAESGGDDVQAEAAVKLLLDDQSGVNIDIYSPSVLWFRTECYMGEAPLGGYCQHCAPLTYGTDPESRGCTSCPVNAECTGGDNITPLAGFWHSGPYSAQIHRCPNKQVCQYGGNCSVGYEGNVCGRCKEGYGSTGAFKCGRCMARARTLGLYLLAGVVVLLVLDWLVHSKIRDDLSPGVTGDRPSDYMKIVIRHLQYLAVIGAIGVRWPRYLGGIISAAVWFFTASDPEVVSLDCLFPTGHAGGMPLAVKRVLVYLFAPICILVGMLLLLVLEKGLWKLLGWCGVVNWRQWGVLQRVLLTVSGIVVLFFFYPTFLRLALGFFACYGLDSPKSMVEGGNDPYPHYAVANASGGYWVSDIQQPCWEGWHKAWALGLGVPLAAIFCLGVPLAVLLLLTLNRTKMDQRSTFSECFGFLYHNYRPKRFYWEVVSIVQLAVVVAISVFTHTLGPYFSALLLQLAFFIICGLQHIFKPYSSKLLNDTALLSAAVLFFTSSITLSLFRVDLEAPPVYGDVMGMVGLVVNVLFVLWGVYMVLKCSAVPFSRLLGFMRWVGTCGRVHRSSAEVQMAPFRPLRRTD